MNLEKLLRVVNPEVEHLIARNKIRLVRHTMKNRTDGDWAGFDERLKFDNDLLLIFTAEQSENKYKDSELILVFVATEGGRCLFRGGFTSKGIVSKDRFTSLHPKYKEYCDFRNENNIAVNEGDHFYFELEKSDVLSEFQNRLIIDWGGSTVSWVQKQINKEISEIMPKGFISDFPGWENVFISHQMLRGLINNPEGNKDWHRFLSGHDGVYLILDKKTNQRYVGSAYSDRDGSGGIWGRWSGYVKTGNNGNKGLVVLTDLDPTHCENFMYSIHHVTPRGPTTKSEVLHFEQLLKRKIGSELNWN